MNYKIYRSTDEGIQIILQKDEQGDWYTVHGGDFYVLTDAGQWLPFDHIGFYRWMKRTGLAKFVVGEKHKVLFDGRWRNVDRYGIYAFADEQPNILLGSMILDSEWDAIMAQVLEDKLVTKETGELPE